MRTIVLNRREARMLRTQLTSSQKGYDYVDLRRLDRLADKLTELLGDYGERLAELAIDEKRLRRILGRREAPEKIEAANQELVCIGYEVEDMDEAAETVTVPFHVEDSDYKLVKDKLQSVEAWMGRDGIRHVVLGMLDAVFEAKTEESSNGKVKKQTEPVEA